MEQARAKKRAALVAAMADRRRSTRTRTAPGAGGAADDLAMSSREYNAKYKQGAKQKLRLQVFDRFVSLQSRLGNVLVPDALEEQLSHAALTKASFS